jgi:hypothetical protein
MIDAVLALVVCGAVVIALTVDVAMLLGWQRRRWPR